jgi:site-specific recombinase XerD
MSQKQVSLSDAIEGFFIAAHARRLAPGTLADYDNALRKFEAWLGSDPPLATITPAEVRGFLRAQDHVSASTLGNYHIGLSALWTWAVREELVERHVVRAVERPKREKRVIVPYSREDVAAMLAACDRSRAYVRPGKRKCDHERPTALRDQAIIKLLVDTGVRASELCALRIRDLDMTNLRVKVMGKGSKERLLAINARTAQAIWRYLATREDRRPVDPLFATRSGQFLDRHNLRHMLKRSGERAGVSGVTVHRFRHTFAIQFLRNGGNMEALKEMLGHSTFEMVERYLHIVQADIDKVHRTASPVGNWLL